MSEVSADKVLIDITCRANSLNSLNESPRQLPTSASTIRMRKGSRMVNCN